MHGFLEKGCDIFTKSLKRLIYRIACFILLSAVLLAAGPPGGGVLEACTGCGFAVDGGTGEFSSHQSVIAMGGLDLPTYGDAAGTPYSAGDCPGSVALGDLDGDGDLDIVTANRASDNVSVLPGNGDGTFASQSTCAVGDYPTSVALGDLDKDDDLDIVTTNHNSNNVSVLLGNGNGTFAAQNTYGTNSGPMSVALGDLDDDGALDIVTANHNSNNISVLLGNGDGTFGLPTYYSTGMNPWSVVLGKLDGDGALDIVTANRDDDNVSVLLGNGNGTFTTHSTYQVGTEPMSVAPGDVNKDGDLDIVTANYNTNNVSVLPGNGDGTFGAQSAYGMGTDPRSVALGDFNHDSDLDIVTANEGSDTVSILPRKGGNFLTSSHYGAGTDPLLVVLGDLDGDGTLDIVTANCGSDDVSVLLNSTAIIEIGNITLDIGGSGSVDVWARGISPFAAGGMGTYTISVYYDDTMVDITGVGGGDSWWGSPEGWSDQGDHVQVHDHIVGCPGPRCPGACDSRLFRINFDCTGAGNMTWEIDTRELADCHNADGIPYIEADGWCQQGPTPTPTPIPTPTPTATPTPTPTITPTPTPPPIDDEEEVDEAANNTIVSGIIIMKAPGNGTVESFEARTVYNPAGINMVDIRDGDSPFTGLTKNIDNTAGNATFEKALGAGNGIATPCKVARLVPRLVGNAGVAYNLEVYFDDITGSGGSESWAPQIIIYRRGDANGDGKVSIKDAMVAAQYIAGNRPLGAVHAVNLASVKHDNGGDEVLGSDDMFIAQYRAGLRDAAFNWTG